MGEQTREQGAISTTVISDPSGPTYVLAADEQSALAWVIRHYGASEVEGIEYVGWMARVAYPDGYGSREEWEQSLDFCESYWEGCQAPVNDKQRKHARQAWEVRFQ